jgi:hypothetical protein
VNAPPSARSVAEAGQDPRAGQDGTYLWYLSRSVPLPRSALGTRRDKCPPMSPNVPPWLAVPVTSCRRRPGSSHPTALPIDWLHRQCCTYRTINSVPRPHNALRLHGFLPPLLRLGSIWGTRAVGSARLSGPAPDQGRCRWSSPGTYLEPRLTVYPALARCAMALNALLEAVRPPKDPHRVGGKPKGGRRWKCDMLSLYRDGFSHLWRDGGPGAAAGNVPR